MISNIENEVEEGEKEGVKREGGREEAECMREMHQSYIIMQKHHKTILQWSTDSKVPAAFHALPPLLTPTP